MDFITGLPKTRKQHDAIMVVVDKLSKATHFIPIKYKFKAINFADLLLKEVFRLHGVPKTIISNRDVKFTSKFCKSLLGKINYSILNCQTRGFVNLELLSRKLPIV